MTQNTTYYEQHDFVQLLICSLQNRIKIVFHDQWTTSIHIS